MKQAFYLKPTELLPIQIPLAMATVERQLEDVPHNMIPYVDSEGNAYDFAFDLNGDGLMRHERVPRYVNKYLVKH